MKRMRIFDSLKSRKLRYGGYAMLITVVGIVAVILVSLIMDRVSWKIDMTQRGVFTLSAQTNRVLAELKQDITITTIKYGKDEDPSMKEILRRYSMRSNRIALRSIDPDRDPQWSKQFVRPGGYLRDGTIVVQSAARFKTIDPYDLRLSTANIYDPNAAPEVVSFSAESLLTSAILYVTEAKDVVVGVLQGHGELNLGALDLGTAMGNENYAVRYISLLSEPQVPADIDILLAIGPGLDLSAEEAAKIGSFLDAGGRAMFLLDLPDLPGARPVTDRLLARYGVTMRNLLVVEGDASMISLNNPIYLLPKLEYHDITEPLDKSRFPIFIPASQAIRVLESPKAYVTVEPLLSSSAKAWGKEHYQDLRTQDREAGDPAGPFTLAAAITQKSGDPARRDTKLVVVGSALFLNQQFTSTQPGNAEFFLNCMAWLGEKKLNIAIRPKDLSTSRLRIDTSSSYLLSGIAVILMPLLVLGAGLAVWVRRRHL